MKLKKISNFLKMLSLMGFFLFILNGCTDPTIIYPKGFIAVKEHNVIIISFIVMLIVVIPVIFMTVFFSLKYKESNKHSSYKPNWVHSYKIEFIIWTIPILIILFLANLAFKSTHQLEPRKTIHYNHTTPIIVDVISLDWRWLFIYPQYHIATINELVFPVNTPIKFHITSNSVMNAFFIPSLGSQIYAMPGMKTELNLLANQTGHCTGFSSNYSGRGFSNMKFSVLIVLNKEKFHGWIQKVQESMYTLPTYESFKNLTLPTENSRIQYFSNVNPALFNKLILNIIKSVEA